MVFLSDKVLSCRIKKYENERYVVEHYIMSVEDEIEAFMKSKYDYHIRYQDYLMTEAHLRKYFAQKCRKNGYDDTQLFNGQELHIENINEFLATHYFKTRGYDAEQHRVQQLNAFATQYINAFNQQLDNDQTLFNLEEYNQENYRGMDTQLIEHLQQCKRKLEHSPISNIECMNVGQGNFSIGYDDLESPLVVFDIGVPKSSRYYAIQKLHSIDGEGIVVISHYDADHIRGIPLMDRAAQNRLWILPQPQKSPSSMAIRLFNFIDSRTHHNAIILGNVDYTLTPFDPAVHLLSIGNMDIYRGNAKKIDLNQSTDENARCLICLVSNNDRSILLPGDSLYAEFPKTFSVNYMIVPHHSCKYNTKIVNLDIGHLKKLIVCAGPHSGYHHPNATHLRRLKATKTNTILLAKHDMFYFEGTNRVKNKVPSAYLPNSCRISL